MSSSSVPLPAHLPASAPPPFLRHSPRPNQTPLQNPSPPLVSMVLPHSDAKHGARSGASPNPIPAPSSDRSNLQHQLLHAACDGDLRLLKRLVTALDEGRGRPREAVEAAKDNGVGALHVAAKNGWLPVCRYLVEELGVDIDAVTVGAGTPLVWATLDGRVDTASYLLCHGANPSKADDEGFTPLHHAAGTGDSKIVELLLAKGVYVDPVSVCGTPLHISASYGHAEAMEVLLENNANHSKIVPGIDTPLLAAIYGSSVKCVRLLVEAGADVNDGLVTPLVSAANKGLTTYLKCLLEAGADPNAPDPAMEHDPHDATLLSNRSLCCLRMGDGHKALQDALACREMRPNWPKGCYRHGLWRCM